MILPNYVKNRFRPHHPEEYKKLMEWSVGAKSVLEVGSRYGFTLYDFACHSGCQRIVGVDLPGPDEQWGFPDSGPSLEGNVNKLKEKGFDAHCIFGKSQDPEVIEKVKALGPYDFIFIDADHRYDAVLKDWENYGPLGKRIAFHDIRKPGPGENQSLEVWKLWALLRGRPDTEEYLAQGSKMGIGRIGSF